MSITKNDASTLIDIYLYNNNIKIENLYDVAWKILHTYEQNVQCYEYEEKAKNASPGVIPLPFEASAIVLRDKDWLIDTYIMIYNTLQEKLTP